MTQTWPIHAIVAVTILAGGDDPLREVGRVVTWGRPLVIRAEPFTIPAAASAIAMSEAPPGSHGHRRHHHPGGRRCSGGDQGWHATAHHHRPDVATPPVAAMGSACAPSPS